MKFRQPEDRRCFYQFCLAALALTEVIPGCYPRRVYFGAFVEQQPHGAGNQYVVVGMSEQEDILCVGRKIHGSAEQSGYVAGFSVAGARDRVPA